MFFPKTVPAADLPSLPVAPEIRTGVLANGLTYYLVTNPSFAGLVDVALVQRAGLQDENESSRGETTVQSRASLTDLPHFSRSTPFSFMRDKAMWPSSEGFVKVGEDATVFRFDRLVLSRGREIVDSTLLMVFDIVGRGTGPMKKYYSPQNQAVIVAGDINAEAVLGKMNMLSLLVPVSPGETAGQQYKWEDRIEPEYSFRKPIGNEPESIHVVYRYPRTARENMSTAIPLVSSRYASELKVIIIRRLSRALRAAGIPYGAIHFDYVSSAACPGDERFEVEVDVTGDRLAEAAAVAASVFSDLDRGGVTIDEYKDVAGQMSTELARRYGREMVSNAHYVNRCISSFLYGADLASAQTRMDFFSRRIMEDRTAVSLFNNFVSALFDKGRNLTITAVSNVDPGDLKEVFQHSWDTSVRPVPVVCRADSTLLQKSPVKSKIKSEVPEPMSGGQLWTFANGIRVIYRPLKDKTGLVHYSWLLKGGFSQMQGLLPGEGACLSDVFCQGIVSGMSYERFNDMLLANGVMMQVEVTMSDFRITGVAPKKRLNLLMKSLQAMTSDRKYSQENYDFYRQCSAIRNKEIPPVRPALDSLLHNDLAYSDVRRPVELRDDFPKMAERYFASQTGKMNDGVLVISGNLDEVALKKLLCRYMGGFRTEKVSAARSRIRRDRVSTRRTVWTRGERPLIGMAFSSPFTYTSESFMAANVAASAMRDAVSSAIASSGWRTEADWKVTLFPEEALNLVMVLSPASPDGLPASLMPEDSVDNVLSRARKAVSAIGSRGITQRSLVSGKSMTSNAYAAWMSSPSMVSYMLFMRYCYGKDLMTDYSSRIASVTPAKVNPVLDGLASGGIAEYVVRGIPAKVVDPVLQDQPLPVAPPLVPFQGNFYYPFEGDIVPLDSLNLADLANIPVREYAQDSTWVAVRDSMYRSWGRPVPGDTVVVAVTDSLAAAVDSLSVAADSLAAASDTLSVPVDSTAVTPLPEQISK